jgi:predicted Zn-dependent peptidase
MVAMHSEMPAPGKLRSWCPPVPELVVHPNGLRTVAIRTPGQPLACVEFIFPAAAHHEPAELEGIRWVVADLLAVGPADRDGLSFQRRLGLLGAEFTAVVDPFMIRLRLQCAAERITEAVAQACEAISGPVITKESVDRTVQRCVSAMCFRQNEQAEIKAAAEIVFSPSCRYGRPTEGTAGSLRRLRPADVSGYLASVIVPERTYAVIAGDGVDDRAFEPLAQWSAAPVLPVVSRDPYQSPQQCSCPPMPSRGVRSLPAAGTQAQVVIAALGPGLADVGWPAMLAAVHLLAGSQLSVLDILLRERQGLTFGVRGVAQPTPTGSVVAISATVDRGGARHAAADIRTAIDATLRDGFTEADRSACVRSLTDAAARQLQTSAAVAAAYASSLGRGLDTAGPARLHASLGQLTTRDMLDALRSHLADHACLILD